MNYIKLEALENYTSKILPSVYGEALSYSELLGKVVDYLNTSLINIDEFNTTLKEFLAKYNDTAVQVINDLLEAMIEDGRFNTYLDAQLSKIDEINAGLEPFKSEITNARGTEANLSNRLTAIVALINADITNNNKAFAEATGEGVVNGLNVLQQSSPNMTVLISPGTAHLFNGKRYELLENATTIIDTPNPLYPRIDIIYINSDGVLTYGKGEATSNPIAPTPVNGLMLAEIYVDKTDLSVVNSMITDKRKMKNNIDGLKSIVDTHDSQLADMTNKISVTNTNVSDNTSEINAIKADNTTISAQLAQTKTKTDWIVNVKEFGAKGDGVTDDTHAFNLATRGYEQHTGGNSSDFNRTIIVPDGNYLIEGTVFVHKGQHLKGSGLGPSRILIPVKTSEGPTFRMGHSLVDGVEIPDSGGLPPTISDLVTEGGATNHAVFDGHGVAGISLNNLFITSASIGIDMPGGDFHGYNLTLDDGSVGIKLGGSRNVITACSFFWNQFSIMTKRDTYDVIISDSNFFYDRFASIQIGNHRIKNLKITDCNFGSNGQDSTFLSTIFLYDVKDADMTISNCHFSNQPGYAIKHHGVTSNNSILIDDCVFDGDKTHDLYIQGSTSMGIEVGQNKIKIYLVFYMLEHLM